jgi:hypothetical protein
MEEKPKHKIGLVAMIILTVLAIVFDLLGLIPIVKDIEAPIFWAIAGIYFWTKGMGIFNGRKLAAVLASFITSIIPVVQELPVELTLGIIAIFIMTRVEEKTGISASSLAGAKSGKITDVAGAVVRAPEARKPLNQGGQRLPPSQPLEDEGVPMAA